MILRTRMRMSCDIPEGLQSLSTKLYLDSRGPVYDVVEDELPRATGQLTIMDAGGLTVLMRFRYFIGTLHDGRVVASRHQRA